MPKRAASWMIGQGVSSRSSHSWAAGRITFSAKPCSQSTSVSWSSLSSSEKSFTASPRPQVPSGYSSVTSGHRECAATENDRRTRAGRSPSFVGLVDLDSLGQWPPVARLNVKSHRLAFDEGASSVSLNLRVVHEDVGLAFDCDKTPALLIVEPLHGSYSHYGPPSAADRPPPVRREPQRRPRGPRYFVAPALPSDPSAPDQGPVRAVLDGPTEAHQFVAQPVGGGPVLASPGLIARGHQARAGLVDVVGVAEQAEPQGAAQRVDGTREDRGLTEVSAIRGRVSRGGGVEDLGHRARGVEVVVQAGRDRTVEVVAGPRPGEAAGSLQLRSGEPR